MNRLEKIQGCEVGLEQEEEDAIPAQLDELQGREEIFWHQKARVNQINYGDHSITFFHQTTLNGRRRNKILKVQSADGMWTNSKKKSVALEFMHFYKRVFESKGGKNLQDVLDQVQSFFLAQDNAIVRAKLTTKEVKSAVFMLGG